MSVFVAAGPAEILRAVQKDRILLDLVEKQVAELVLKIGGTAVWLRYRQIVQVCSRFLYYSFTTLSGFQTLGEEYTNIVEVDVTLKRIPTFLQRLLVAIAESAGFTFLETILNKLHRKVSENCHMQDDFKRKMLTCIDVTKSMLPFLIHFHHAIFYWNGTYYDMVKRIIGIRYIRSKPWLSKDSKLYGFKILSAITLLHLSISGTHFVHNWITKHSVNETPTYTVSSKSSSNCPLCLESRTNTSCTPCGHLYCWYCILNWLQTNNQCPICRDIIEPNRIVPLLNYY
ncbi:peroxisome assembly protein 10-B-like [Planococcus citri]|uniref:peroxisome assembly protein 10-B-like n=1 Tax=Planococcus citri TaxID=170843 RepID=UPI0031F85880